VGKLPYKEGSWFAVPLRQGGYASGVVARVAPRGRVILVYLFGPPRDQLPSFDDVAGLQAKDAARCLRVGDLGLVNGEWPIIGNSNLDHDAWPMPSFVGRDDLTGRMWRSTYSDHDPSKLERQEPIVRNVEDLERDVLFGYGAVEILMTKVLKKKGH
jgi:hypothetical protein